jgi:hypothetical protein
MNLRCVALDVDESIEHPSLLEPAEAISRRQGGEAVNIRVDDLVVGDRIIEQVLRGR